MENHVTHRGTHDYKEYLKRIDKSFRDFLARGNLTVEGDYLITTAGGEIVTFTRHHLSALYIAGAKYSVRCHVVPRGTPAR